MFISYRKLCHYTARNRFHCVYPKHLCERQHRTSQVTSTIPTVRSPPLTLSLCSASCPRTRADAALIEIQPPVPATKLRRIPVTRRGTIICPARDQRRRLDALAVGVAAAIASAPKGKKWDISSAPDFFFYGTENMYISPDLSVTLVSTDGWGLTESPIRRPCTGTARSTTHTARP